MQKFCIIHYWRGTVNAIIGPFDTQDEAEAVAVKMRNRNPGDRDAGIYEVRIQTRSK